MENDPVSSPDDKDGDESKAHEKGDGMDGQQSQAPEPARDSGLDDALDAIDDAWKRQRSQDESARGAETPPKTDLTLLAKTEPLADVDVEVEVDMDAYDGEAKTPLPGHTGFSIEGAPVEEEAPQQPSVPVIRSAALIESEDMNAKDESDLKSALVRQHDVAFSVELKAGRAIWDDEFLARAKEEDAERQVQKLAELMEQAKREAERQIEEQFERQRRRIGLLKERGSLTRERSDTFRRWDGDNALYQAALASARKHDDEGRRAKAQFDQATADRETAAKQLAIAVTEVLNAENDDAIERADEQGKHTWIALIAARQTEILEKARWKSGVSKFRAELKKHEPLGQRVKALKEELKRLDEEIMGINAELDKIDGASPAVSPKA